MRGYLQPSEQWAVWKQRNIDEPRRIKKVLAENAAGSDLETKAYLKSHFCKIPFEMLETLGQGAVNTCCPDWLPMSIGEIDDIEGAWNSRAATKIRRSIVDGDFKYCSHAHCALITNRWLVPRERADARALIERFDADNTAPPPRELKLSHDRSCNLSCPSCRTEILAAGKAKQARLDDQIETSILPVLRGAESVYITGSGDPFASAHFRRLIKRLSRKDFPDLRLRLHTNAQLLDERAWRDLDLSGRVESMEISIDAAEADTYAVVRRPGSFARLLKNLAFVKHLRESGDLKRLEISMVVQALNFREMPAFARLGHWVGADLIFFEMIRNWGVYSPEEFAKVRVDQDHPDFAEMVEVLQSPELNNDPRVMLGGLTQYVRRSSLKKAA